MEKLLSELVSKEKSIKSKQNFWRQVVFYIILRRKNRSLSVNEIGNKFNEYFRNRNVQKFNKKWFYHNTWGSILNDRYNAELMYKMITTIQSILFIFCCFHLYPSTGYKKCAAITSINSMDHINIKFLCDYSNNFYAPGCNANVRFVGNEFEVKYIEENDLMENILDEYNNDQYGLWKLASFTQTIKSLGYLLKTIYFNQDQLGVTARDFIESIHCGLKLSDAQIIDIMHILYDDLKEYDDRYVRQIMYALIDCTENVSVFLERINLNNPNKSNKSNKKNKSKAINIIKLSIDSSSEKYEYGILYKFHEFQIVTNNNDDDDDDDNYDDDYDESIDIKMDQHNNNNSEIITIQQSINNVIVKIQPRSNKPKLKIIIQDEENLSIESIKKIKFNSNKLKIVIESKEKSHYLSSKTLLNYKKLTNDIKSLSFYNKCNDLIQNI